MHAKQWVMMRILLDHFHSGKAEAILQSLPQEEAKAILSQEVPENAIQSVHHSADLLNKVHPSWLIPEVKKYSISMQKMFLRAFPEPHRSKIQKALKMDFPGGTPLPSMIKTFFMQRFYTQLPYKEVLPIGCLPSSPVHLLLQWDEAALLELIDILGIYDIVDDFRRIIDKEKVVAIHRALSAKQRDFLRKLLPQKEKVIGSPINLRNWQGDHAELHRLIQSKGIVRLARALSGQHPDFLWHIAHTLDMEQGSILSHFYTVSTAPGITPALLQQTLNAIHFLNEKSVK